MAAIEFKTRRAAFAFAIAIAAVIAPVTVAPQAVADPDNCTASTEPGNVSLDCAPGVMPGGGAPGEMQLTEDNPGINSPSHRN